MSKRLSVSVSSQPYQIKMIDTVTKCNNPFINILLLSIDHFSIYMRCYIILRDFLNAFYTEIMSGEPMKRTNNVELIMYIYYRSAHLSRFQMAICPGFGTGIRLPGQKS